MTRYYEKAVTIVDAGELGGAMTTQLISVCSRKMRPVIGIARRGRSLIADQAACFAVFLAMARFRRRALG